MSRLQFLPGVAMTHDVGPVSSSVALPASGGNIRIVNDSKVNVWIEYGGADVVASPRESMLLTPGYTSMMRMPARATHIAAICPAKGAASLNITFGDGS